MAAEQIATISCSGVISMGSRSSTLLVLSRPMAWCLAERHWRILHTLGLADLRPQIMRIRILFLLGEGGEFFFVCQTKGPDALREWRRMILIVSLDRYCSFQASWDGETLHTVGRCGGDAAQSGQNRTKTRGCGAVLKVV